MEGLYAAFGWEARTRVYIIDYKMFIDILVWRGMEWWDMSVKC